MDDSGSFKITKCQKCFMRNGKMTRGYVVKLDCRRAAYNSRPHLGSSNTSLMFLSNRTIKQVLFATKSL